MRVFVAGATGATGSVFVPLARAAGHDVIPHVRPTSRSRTPLGQDPQAAIFELAELNALAEALDGCDVVLSFVGTMRARFARGDTYESSDVGSTVSLVAGALRAGVPRFLLMSSYGAGGPGAYLRMKGTCEQRVRESGLRWTIVRPSALESPGGKATGTHGARPRFPGAGTLFGALGAIPGLRPWADAAKPIGIDVVCRAFVRLLVEPRDGAILEGSEIYALAART